MNYIYSPEGTTLSNWGIEGETFVYGDDGFPQFLPLMYDNPDGFSLPDTLRRYARPPSGAFIYDWRRELTPGTDQDVINALDIWMTGVDYAWHLPPLTLSADEGVDFSRIMNDVNTHRDEMVARFITGAEPLTNFDNFVDTLISMGIHDAIAIQQGALDRFNAR
jgi:putative aldouronate transport system substrate-binding protein